MRLHLNGLRDSFMASQLHANSLSGLVKISVSHACGRAVLLPRLAQFKKQHPEVLIQVSLADGIDDLLNKQLDLTIRFGALPDSTLVALSLGNLSVALVGATKQFSGKQAPRTISSLGAYPTIGF